MNVKFLLLSLNTARDIIRQPVVVVLTIACIVTTGMLPVIAVFSLGQEERIVRDGAIASGFIYGLLLVVSSSIASIFKQIRSGTAAGILCKPVSRKLFLGATYFGIVLVCFLFVTITMLSAIIGVRMALEGIHTDWLIGMIYLGALLSAFAVAAAADYRGQNFCSALFQSLIICFLPALFVVAFLDPGGRLVHFGEFIRWRIVPVSLLLFGALSMLSAIAVALSTRFTPVVVFFCCCLVFAIGLISDYLFLTVAGGGPLAIFCSAVLPNWQCLWVYEADPVTWGYVLKAFGYAGLYIAAVLCLGILSFRNADV